MAPRNRQRKRPNKLAACGLDKLGDGGRDAGGKEDGDGWEVRGWGMKF